MKKLLLLISFVAFVLGINAQSWNVNGSFKASNLSEVEHFIKQNHHLLEIPANSVHIPPAIPVIPPHFL
ncbi:MAG: hypothetical protein LBI45_09050 [Bacteroidales bacterium]|nr:hypothetical protein [Bacteroidales bacterium]